MSFEYKDEILDAICKSMRCVYGVPHDEPIDKAEWFGTFDQGGVRDFIWSLIRDEAKKAYKCGYITGATAAHVATCVKHDLATDFSEEDAKVGAEREFCKWEAR